jgi:hypothetical protein
VARRKKDINLLDALEGKKKVGLSVNAIVGLACIPLVALVAAVAVFVLVAAIADLSGQRDQLRNYVENQQTEAASAEVASTQRQAYQARADADAVMAMLRYLSSSPDLYGEHYDRIFEMAGVEIELTNFTYDRQSGMLRFNASAAELSSLPRFVEQMRASGFFSDVQYRGYVQTTTSSASLAGSGSGTSGTSGDATTSGVASAYASSASVPEIVSYYYSLECQVVFPEPTLPALAAQGEGETGGGE